MNMLFHTASSLVAALEIELSADAHAHLRAAALPGNWSPADYLQRLLDHDHRRDARHFLAHGLPPRRALWWACLCARDVREFAAEAQLAPTIDLAVRFVRMPTESTRREAQRVMQAHPLNTLTAHMAAAIFMSHGSLTPPEAEAIAVPPPLLGRLVSTIVYMAATKKNVVRYLHHMREYIELGREIAEGQHLWPQAVEKRFRLDDSHQPLLWASELHSPTVSTNRSTP